MFLGPVLTSVGGLEICLFLGRFAFSLGFEICDHKDLERWVSSILMNGNEDICVSNASIGLEADQNSVGQSRRNPSVGSSTKTIGL